jgi:DNA polymerase-3 subunit gamma/tau
MAGYIVLARKYRSTTFDEVVGQESIAQTLKNGIAAGRIAQAYLFTGTRGVGKTTVARILAKALNCLSSDKPTVSPCNKCGACEAIAAGDDIDVIEIDGASNRGIDEIRQLRANVSLRPSRSRYKIYYIDEVHQITRDGFNALLKTLEEPPPHVKFIFATTEAEKIPATILSRCQRFDFRNIPTRQIAQHLSAICKAENVQADQDALFRIARYGAGSMRDALSLLDQILCGSGKVTDEDVVRTLGTPGDERTYTLVRAIAKGSSAEALGELAALLEGGVTLQSLLAAVSDVLRNMMLVLTCGEKSDLIELPDVQRQTVAQLAKMFSLPTIVQAQGVIQATGRNLRLSTVGRALVEAAIVRLAEADKFIDPQSLIERLGGAGEAQKKKLTSPAEPPPAAAQTPQVQQRQSPAQPQPAAPAPPVPRAATALSTQEKSNILKDASVRAVIDLFGGGVSDFRVVPPGGTDA